MAFTHQLQSIGAKHALHWFPFPPGPHLHRQQPSRRKKIRRINKLGKEIKELKWEYINVKSELMFRSKMSEVSKSVEPLGLKQLSSPPQKIELAKDTQK